MSVVETQEQTETEAADNGQKSKYVIFKRIGDNTWQELGSVEAVGAYAARAEAVKKYDLMQEVREGKLEIASLGARFWMPKTPKVSVSESLDVS